MRCSVFFRSSQRTDKKPGKNGKFDDKTNIMVCAFSFITELECLYKFKCCQTIYVYRIFQPSRFQAIAAYKLNVLTKQFRRARISSRFISRQYKQWCADSICNGLCYAAKWKTFRKSLSVSLIPAFFHKVLLAGPLKSLEFRHSLVSVFRFVLLHSSCFKIECTIPKILCHIQIQSKS